MRMEKQDYELAKELIYKDIFRFEPIAFSAIGDYSEEQAKLALSIIEERYDTINRINNEMEIVG